LSIDALAYRLKQNMPWAFQCIEYASTAITVMRHSRRRAAALGTGTIHGTIGGSVASIRPLSVEDLGVVSHFFSVLSEDHLRFFHPHSFAELELQNVLNSKTRCCYGLYKEDQLVGYCIIKLFPTKNAYCGRVLAPSILGRGLGKFLWQYLIWQAALMGVTPNATVNRNNLPSIHSLKSIRPDVRYFSIQNDELRVVIPSSPYDQLLPELCV